MWRSAGVALYTATRVASRLITHLTGFKFLFNSGRLGFEILCRAGTIGVEGNCRPLCAVGFEL